jgi:sialidase-1
MQWIALLVASVSLPAASPPATAPALKHVIVCSDAGAGGYEAFPDVARTKKGELLCVFYAGFSHVSLPKWAPGGKLPENCAQAGRICMVRSRDDGKTWSKAEIVVDTPLDDRDPSIVELPNGDLLCDYFCLRANDKPGYEVVHSALVRSRDDGRTWSEPQPLFDRWVPSSPIRVLSDGHLAMSLYYVGPDARPNGSYAGFAVSSDNGRTWSKPVAVGKGSEIPMDAEPDVCEVTKGNLLMVLRPAMAYSWSHDDGKTWSEAKRIGFEGHAPYLLKTKTGVLLLAHRLPGTSLHYSLDDGRTWSGSVQLDTVGGAYPSLCELADGSVYCVYYEEGPGSSIRGVRFRADREGIRACEP